ncbi:Ser/Arg-rich splicing factor, putative [Babesia bigemina]|uniref:Ser/Arg-rich splicing factor, putative n=1 Tax=Babesia bigemina TaxID=5866 RepID=A0A061D5V8_BABBI|nr:Ser/Arg-rich splicing factor, putative [Babesia bigemina]CDR94294.1 Ser/Arg-rich splicing factor, putative [Babesia bigemina]|eukprot:XP_012766480.1 Ser/Arg-rich splicing factor, putative [Babesia bigemina]
MGSRERHDRRHASLLVRNLKYETSPEQLRSAFSKFGEIRDVYLPLDYYTRKPRGFGFVEFFSHSDADEAMREMFGYELDGNKIEVFVAKHGRSDPYQMVSQDAGSRRFIRKPRRSEAMIHSKTEEQAPAVTCHKTELTALQRNRERRRRRSRDRSYSRDRRRRSVSYDRHRRRSISRSRERYRSRERDRRMSRSMDRPSPRMRGDSRGRNHDSPKRSDGARDYSRSQSRSR